MEAASLGLPGVSLSLGPGVCRDVRPRACLVSEEGNSEGNPGRVLEREGCSCVQDTVLGSLATCSE